jgi:hypothetical protein
MTPEAKAEEEKENKQSEGTNIPAWKQKRSKYLGLDDDNDEEIKR